MSKQSTVRHVNQARILTRLVEFGALSRADLARELNLMRSTTGSLVDHLLKDGLIRESRSSEKSIIVGRPSVKFELNPQHCYFVIFDIDPHQSEIQIFDFALNLIAKESIDSADLYENPQEFARALSMRLERIIEEFSVPIAKIVYSMMVVPALVNREGFIGYAPSLGWKNVPFKEIFFQQGNANFPIILENDANAFALYELAKSEKDQHNNVYFWLDDGVGGGVVLENTLIRGHSGFAGEFGHIHNTTVPHHSKIPLGESVENIIGRTGLLFQHQYNGAEPISFSEFLAALDEHDPIALKTFEQWCIVVAQTLGSLVGILNPEKVVFGGPLSVLAERGKDTITEQLERFVLMKEAQPEIVISKVNSNEIALGCAHMLRQDFININRDAFFAID